jgi:hypothetical protein
MNANYRVFQTFLLKRSFLHIFTLVVAIHFLLFSPAIARDNGQAVTLGRISIEGIEGSDGSMMHRGENDPHMRMTPMRSPTAKDLAKADKLARELKEAISKYADIAAAEADGYRPFPPNPRGLRIVHYVNLGRSVAENWKLNPRKPGSLLYERQPDNSLRLIGAMVTASKKATEAELNARVPLSVARWHLHTNICVPKPIWDGKQWAIKDNGRPRFGPESTISTEAACKAVGGDFWPTAFGWMVHAYVFAENPRDIWNQMY